MADLRWLLVLAGLFVLAEAVVYRRLSLWRVTYRRFFSQSAIAAGDSVEMVEVIENRKWLPIPRVVLEAAFDASMRFGGDSDTFLNRSEKFLTIRSMFSLRPYTRITRRHQIQCVRRGLYRLNTAAMTLGGMFGGEGFKQWAFSGPGTTLTVYPKLVPDVHQVLSTHSFQGDTLVRRFIVPDPFVRQGARPYQDGDSLNQIHWKATARTGALHVHLQEYTADYHVKILLNFIIEEDMWQHISNPLRIEAGISLAATLASEWIESGCMVGFNCNGLHLDGADPNLDPGSGMQQLEDIWSLLAGLDLKLRCDCSGLLREEWASATRKTDYVLITGFVDEALHDAIRLLEESGHSVSIVHLPSETVAFEWMGLNLGSILEGAGSKNGTA